MISYMTYHDYNDNHCDNHCDRNVGLKVYVIHTLSSTLVMYIAILLQ